MHEPTQHELDEAMRKTYLIPKEETLNSIKHRFEELHASLKLRSTYDQTIIGNVLTVLEMDLKGDIKKLKAKVK